MIENIPDKITDKVPGFEEYKKSTKSAISYIFMLMFFMYFLYSEFFKRDDCGQRIATLEKVINEQKEMDKKKDARISALEVALDIRNGVIKRVESKTDSLSHGQIGGLR